MSSREGQPRQPLEADGGSENKSDKKIHQEAGMSRRDLLKGLGVAAGIAAVGVGMYEDNKQREKNAEANKERYHEGVGVIVDKSHMVGQSAIVSHYDRYDIMVKVGHDLIRFSAKDQEDYDKFSNGEQVRVWYESRPLGPIINPTAEKLQKIDGSLSVEGLHPPH